MGVDATQHTGMLRVRADTQVYRSIGLSCLALYAPIFAVLYWLTIPQGTWPTVLLTQSLVVGLSALVLVCASRSTIWVDDTGIVSRGASGRIVSHPVHSIDRVVLVEVYRVDDTDTQPYLIVVGRSGRVLMRMRGFIHTRAAMNTVIDELGAGVDRMPEPVTLADLNRRWPKLLAWFEWRPSRLRQPTA